MARPPKFVPVPREEWYRALALMERIERRLDALEAQERPFKNLEEEARREMARGNLGPFNRLLELRERKVVPIKP